ncbi:MAG: ROK family protein [Treponema sp.]|jgi:glucokinase|nr:ROK family protein [Treponema sp.]
MKRFVIGIDVGGTKTACALVDENRVLYGGHSIPSNPELENERFFDVIVEEVKTLLAGQGFDASGRRPAGTRAANGQARLEAAEIAGAGVGMPSFIYYDKGHIIKTSNLVKIRDFPARDYLSEKLRLQVTLDNDARAAALAEYRHGAGKGFHNMLYCPVSSGISSAILIGGKLFRGSYGWAGETGHMIATPGEGVECGCGNRGCYMSWCSGLMIIKHIRQWIDSGEKTIMTELAGGKEKIDSIILEKAHDAGDRMAVKAFNQMTNWLGIWFYNLYVSLNINCFVLGGGLVKMGEKLLDPVRRTFDIYNHDDFPVYFKTAACGKNCGTLGAAELAWESCAENAM